MATWVIVVIVVAAVLLVIILGIIVWWICTSNLIKRMQVKISEASSGIDVALEKRYDLLTKQLETVKGYAKFESKTLEDVVKLRAGKGQIDGEKLTKFNDSLDKLANEIDVVVERYPDLKASSNFLALQNSITDTEEHIQASRRIFNSNVSIYNQKIVSWPSSMVASSIGAKQETFFKAADHKREDVKIEF